MTVLCRANYTYNYKQQPKGNRLNGVTQAMHFIETSHAAEGSYLYQILG